MTVCSGPSGSGKSSLAIDTLYAEGQRRYVESLSSYARQFLAPLQKPKVERISGLSPAISIEQKTTSKSPRSTVGTVTEIHDYLRILFARLGQPYCPKCGIADRHADGRRDRREGPPPARGDQDLRDGARSSAATARLTKALWDELRASGFARVRVDGKSVSLDKPPKLSHRRKHQIEVVIDRAVVRRCDAVATGRLGRVGARPGQGGRARRPGRRRGQASRAGPSTATASTASATAAAAASTSWRRTTSRSTARWAGARSARGWASSTGPTRRCSSPTAG